jgi:putative restriction endonuclease
MDIRGEVAGVKVGQVFADRRAVYDAGLHRTLVAGIAPKGYSIVLSGGYEDDVDDGDAIIYTGQGGRDQNTGKQIADQELTRGNLSLAQNMVQGVPVRVTRGRDLDSPFAPSAGYRYDGLYQVEDYWTERGKSGFLVYRFRLVRLDGQPPIAPGAGVIPRDLPAGTMAPRRVASVSSRVVRSTEVGLRVKQLYGFQCQFCGTILETPGGRYAECCHIKPLGRPHNGPDVMENVLCLCPNCHVRFDDYAVALNDDLTLTDTGQKIQLVDGHCIDVDYARYHRELMPR